MNKDTGRVYDREVAADRKALEDDRAALREQGRNPDEVIVPIKESFDEFGKRKTRPKHGVWGHLCMPDCPRITANTAPRSTKSKRRVKRAMGRTSRRANR